MPIWNTTLWEAGGLWAVVKGRDRPELRPADAGLGIEELKRISRIHQANFQIPCLASLSFALRPLFRGHSAVQFPISGFLLLFLLPSHNEICYYRFKMNPFVRDSWTHFLVWIMF